MKTSQKANHNQNNKKIFPKYMQEKLAITVLVITLALFALVLALYGLMKNKKDAYNQVVLGQQQYDSKTLPYQRGNIVDRNGTYLATSKRVYNLIIDPKLILSDSGKYLDASVAALVDTFGYKKEDLMKVIQEKSDIHYVKYAKELTNEQKESFEAYKTKKTEELKKAKSGAAIIGITFEPEYKRVYPYNSLACNVIGFMNTDGLGGTGGIEQYYNDTLMGTNGREYGYLNDDSNLERVVKPAINGDNIVSTLDANIQKIVEKHINEWMAQTGSQHTGVVVMNPNNGEILAMASDRQFDLNNPRELEAGYTDDILEELGKKEAADDYGRKHKADPGYQPITPDQAPQFYTHDQIMSLGKQVAWNQTWRNYCISDAFEPGSPAKVMTVSAALEEGAISPSETFECHGVLDVGGWPIKCVAYARGGHGLLTAEQGLMVSCNVVMMQIAQKLGKDKFYKYQQLFGFGSKTGIDLPGEADTKSLVYNAQDTNPASLATNAFGQNFSCTMVQMAAAYCSVINGGSYYQPHVVKQVLNPQGAVVDKMEPKLVRETVSESTAKYINEALWKTVNDHSKPNGGTGGAAEIAGYDIAGKTGTAEKIPRDHKNYLLSFAGYAPAYNPQVFIYVVIDQPHVEDQPHSTYASELFKSIMKEVLPYMNIFPSSGQPATLPQGQPGETTGSGETKAQAPSEGAGETEGASQADDFDFGAPSLLPSQSEAPAQMPPGAQTQAQTQAPSQAQTQGAQGAQ